MKLRIKAWLIAGSAIACLPGCQEPKEIVPVYPPGFEMSRAPVIKEGEGAQAIGEQGVQSSKQNKAEVSAGNSPGSPPTAIGQSTKTGSGLVYETLKEGAGPIAQSGQNVKIHYTGTLVDGKVFDSSRKRNQPFEVTIGRGQVIPGWDEGVPGMKIGEIRRLTIPAELGYGSKGTQGIPPNSTLIFEVELLDAK